MTENIKDSGDDLQPTQVSPPLDSNGATNMSESHPLHSANAETLRVSHQSNLTYASRLSSKRTFRATAIFVICIFVLTLHLHGRSAKEKKHQLIRDGLAWTDVTPSNRCLRYGTREYSAQLMGVPTGEDGLRWCKEKEIIIQRTNYEKPGYCTVDTDNSAPMGLRIYGHWTVSSNEPSCKTLWENFHDKGCVANGSKTRRIEAHMGNHQPPWDNWREMCSTTPADYQGHHFDQPDSCDHRGIFSGVWGVWFVKDESC